MAHPKANGMVYAAATRLALAIGLLAIVGCFGPEPETAHEIPQPDVARVMVKHWGPMRAVMREGQTQSRIQLF